MNPQIVCHGRSSEVASAAEGRRRFSGRRWAAAAGWAVFLLAATGASAQSPADGPLPWSELQGSPGICVVLGEEAVETALQLAGDTQLVIYAQLADPQQLATARQKVIDRGLYGTRIYVESGPLERLYLAADLADALIATGSAAEMPVEEALRVLRPGGRGWVGSSVVIKPAPPGTDDWSHPYHGPDNNPQSRDQRARAPYLTQFLADPRYAPLPQVAVAAGGRVFKAFGHIAFKPREEPWLDTLAAFNGYNGTLLWKREIPPALMVHRNTLIATADVLYFGDDRSCKVIDAATGQLREEIAPPEEIAGGTFWKWMALQDGILYALIGDQEQRDPVIRLRRLAHGWPWNPLSPGYNQPEHTWGFGRTLLAIDPQTHQVLWRHQEQEPIDSRALCMNGQRLFAFRFGSYLTCLDAKSGRVLWRKTPENAAELFSHLGSDIRRQDWRTNWRTTAYLKCSEQALYFAGPQVDRLLAVAADDGRMLWEDSYSNYQLVLRDDGLYALSGQMGGEVGMPGRQDPELSRRPAPSRVFDPLSGDVLDEVDLGRRACTRPTGAIDAVFCRATGGSTRWDADTKEFGLVSPMRAQCHDGVTIANGLLYWWPSTCDCNLTLYGITCLGPAGDFDFSQPAREEERLQRLTAAAPLEPLEVTAGDWPTFRANAACDVSADVVIPQQVQLAWRHSLPGGVTPTPPAAVGDLVFVGGSDGVIRALEASAGRPRWTAATGGAVRLPPSIEAGRALAGSADGWVYAWEAATGRPLWRFRAAPAERRIPVYGQLQSTWPVASGVLAAGGVAYAAAGIVNYDGTYVYALDAATGQIKWQNNTSGHLDSQARTGVSAQGQLLLHEGRLYLAGGNLVSPAVYDAGDGRLLNNPDSHVRLKQNNNVPSSQSPRGADLYRIGDHVLVSGKPLYADPQWDVYDASVERKILLARAGDRELIWMHNARLAGFERGEQDRAQSYLNLWNRPQVDGLQPLWSYDCAGSVALAVGRNAAVLAAQNRLTAVRLADGGRLWQCELPAAALPWGLALTRHGQILVTLQNGEIICLSGAVP